MVYLFELRSGKYCRIKINVIFATRGSPLTSIRFIWPEGTGRTVSGQTRKKNAQNSPKPDHSPPENYTEGNKIQLLSRKKQSKRIIKQIHSSNTGSGHENESKKPSQANGASRVRPCTSSRCPRPLPRVNMPATDTSIT